MCTLLYHRLDAFRYTCPQDKAERAAELLGALSSAGSAVGRAVREGTAELLWRETSPQHFPGQPTMSRARLAPGCPKHRPASASIGQHRPASADQLLVPRWPAMSGSCLRHRQLSGAWSNRNVGWYHQSEARCALAERPQRDERQARLTRTSYATAPLQGSVL